MAVCHSNAHQIASDQTTQMQIQNENKHTKWTAIKSEPLHYYRALSVHNCRQNGIRLKCITKVNFQVTLKCVSLHFSRQLVTQLTSFQFYWSFTHRLALQRLCKCRSICRLILNDNVKIKPISTDGTGLTFALASLADSASAAMARCIWTGRRTSLLQPTIPNPPWTGYNWSDLRILTDGSPVRAIDPSIAITLLSHVVEDVKAT